MSLQVIPEKSRETPLTTCFLYNWCQSPRRAVSTQGSYRLSLEPREKIEGNTVDFQALAPFSKAMGNSESVGRGADGQYWLCLRGLELLYEGRFERLTGDANTPLTHLYEYVRFIESLYPETRPNSSIPGTLNLRSAQKHTVYLWIAVHRYVLYLADPVNAGVKKLLDQGVACEKAFPGDVYPALTGQALYRSTEALNYRGRASNGNFAELTWAQVISRDLSEALVMSEELVATVEKDSNEEEGNGECKDADCDKEKDGKLSLGFFSCFSIPIRLCHVLNSDSKHRAKLWIMLQPGKGRKEASSSTGLSTKPHPQPSEVPVLPHQSVVYSQSPRSPNPPPPLPSSSSFSQSVPFLALTRLFSKRKRHQKPQVRAKKMKIRKWRRVATLCSRVSIRRRTGENTEKCGPSLLQQRSITWKMPLRPSLQAKVRREITKAL